VGGKTGPPNFYILAFGILLEGEWMGLDSVANSRSDLIDILSICIVYEYSKLFVLERSHDVTIANQPLNEAGRSGQQGIN
jgi:hypothetical protein